ncbi:hypothetical protein DN069_09120 [Streptacidiphilus pinicola]|uniref:Uncharacterized protein n=1 Tax=Streptacidiphilus pinicola TaxID=2219663 RepID=A0A2X0IMN1_9ACTN|nr:hypothetical protein [Streptacidiphilus pinicola]RAG85927.1 hypothetical protein DN069_09120 [Streptacidiphilus pinicola]
MSEELTALTRTPWHWEWVPGGGPDRAEPQAWTDRLAAQFAEWTADGLATAREGWPADEAGTPFPLTAEAVGRDVADWLRERAVQLPPWSRLAWGAVAVDGRVRWAPVPVVVEFRAPEAEDPEYLMELVGSGGWEEDAREPVVDYVTTPGGDGLRVLALCRSSEGAAYARLDAALRLDLPPTGDGPGVSADVLLSTRVVEMGLMALIGPGVEQLMQQIAEESAPTDGRPPRLGFVTASAATGEEQT